MDLPALYYLLSFGLLIAVQVLVIVLLLSYRKLLHDNRSLASRCQTLERKISERADDAYRQAQQEVEQLLQEARRMATEIIAESRDMAHDTEALFATASGNFGKLEQSLHTEVTSHIRARMDEAVTQVTQELEHALEKELSLARERIETMSAHITQEEERQFTQITARIEEEFRTYQDKRRQAFEHELSQELKALISDLLPKALSEHDHETLITQAFEELKRERDSHPALPGKNN